MKQLKVTNQITIRESQALDSYLKEISRVVLLDPDEEVILAKKIRQGDNMALEKLISANLRFVVSVAKQYQNQGLKLADLISEGNLGLIKAAQRFDETRGFKFISYAVWWIRQSILQALAENGRLVRLPSNKLGYVPKIKKVFKDLEQEFQREPSTTEIGNLLELAPEIVEIISNNTPDHSSLNSPVKTDETSSFLDTLKSEESSEPDQKLKKVSLQDEIKRLLKAIKPRDAEILEYFYGLNGKRSHTLDEIGEIFSLTRERVRQIKEQSIRKLKEGRRKDSLIPYL